MINTKHTLKWPIIETANKLLLAIVLVFSMQYPFIQLMVINFNSVYVLIALGWIRPYKEHGRNKWELFQ